MNLPSIVNLVSLPLLRRDQHGRFNESEVGQQANLKLGLWGHAALLRYSSPQRTKIFIRGALPTGRSRIVGNSEE